ALDPGDDVVEPHPGQDRHAVPGRLAVRGDLVAAAGQLVAHQLAERVVGDLGLLQAQDIGPALVEPGQQPGHALLERVDVPGHDAHARSAYGEAHMTYTTIEYETRGPVALITLNRPDRLNAW